MRSRLDAFGRRDLSDAVRPEYDLPTDRITRIKTLPKNPATDENRTTWSTTRGTTAWR
jgi:hypothetical protein